MYDVAGSIDDALDHNSNQDLSEGITTTLSFNAPTRSGLKMGIEAINLEVSDEQTESDDTSKRYSVSPFPYPYLVIDKDYEFILYKLTGSNAILDIDYGGRILFGPGTKVSDISTSDKGYRFRSFDGSTVAVIEAPKDSTIVNPVIMSKNQGGGQFVLDMIKYETNDIVTGQPSSTWVTKEYSQLNYKGNLPASLEKALELDIDGDGLFTDNDDDIDGDGVPNDQDSSPFDRSITNHHPNIISVEASAQTIAKNRKLILTAEVTDADQDKRYYTWKLEPGTDWKGSGKSVEVELRDFKPGTYIFTVEVFDGYGGSDRCSKTIEVKDSKSEPGFPIIISLIGTVIVTALLIMILLFVFFNKPKEKKGIHDFQSKESESIKSTNISFKAEKVELERIDIPVKDTTSFNSSTMENALKKHFRFP